MFKNETLPPAINSTAINSTAINSRFPLRDEHNIVALQEPHAANDAKSGSNLLESVCLVLVSGHFVSFIQHDEKLFYLIIRILNSIFFHSQRCQSRSGGRNRRTGELEHSTTVTIVGWAHDIEPLLNRGAEYWVSQNTIADSLYIQYVAATHWQAETWVYLWAHISCFVDCHSLNGGRQSPQWQRTCARHFHTSPWTRGSTRPFYSACPTQGC